MNYKTISNDMTIAAGEGALLANRYRIVRQLGQGGMGSVWLVEDTQLDDKPFAVKMLPSILVSNKRAYRQLKDEALVAMQLVHPNIVQIRAFEENDGNPFLVMDYVDGQTLDDYLAEHTGTTGVFPVAGGLSEAEVLRILRPIAAALDYAHGEGVVHRDVKPANVMIRKDGHPYILDFGIAREIQETMTRVTGKLSSGTLLYMSPEQLMGECPKPAQDVYSFAAMVYECLKGEPPFVRGSIEDQIKNKQPEPPPGGTQLVASVMSGLAKRPDDRPATCAAVLGGKCLSRAERVDFVRRGTFDMSQLGRARSPSAPPDPQPGRAVAPRPPQGGSRSRAIVAIFLLVAVLLAILGGVWLVAGRSPAREASATSREGSLPVQGIQEPQRPKSAEERLHDGQEALQEKDYTRAHELFSSIIKERTLSSMLRSKAFAGRGMVELEQNDAELARVSFLHALLLDSSNAAAHYYLAQIYRSGHFYEAARREFKRFSEITQKSNPDDARARKVDSNVLPELAKLIETKLAERFGPGGGNAGEAAKLVQEAKALEGKKLFSEAAKKYAAARKVDPRSYEAACGYGRRSANTSEKIKAYCDAIALNPDVRDNYVEAAMAALSGGFKMQAVEILNHAIALHPQDKNILAMLCGALLKTGNMKMNSAWTEYRQEVTKKKSKPEMKRGELKGKAKLRTPQPTPRKPAQEPKEMGADESLPDVDTKKMLEKGYRYGARNQLATSEE